MNRTVLFLAVLLIVVTLAPESSALPLFSRQTGMGCSACHFQHFPLLNGFGRAFKSTGFTMMGVQAGQEEGGNPAVPNALNLSILATAGYEKTNQAAGTGPQKTTGDGVAYVPGTGGELSLFLGGRVSDSAGFLAEFGSGGSVAGTTVSKSHSSAKLPVLFETKIPGFKVTEGTLAGFVPFTTDDHGVSYGFELLNTGASVVHQPSPTPGLNGEHSKAFSAQQFIGTDGAATGVAFVASNPVYLINLTKYDQTGLANGALSVLSSDYLRIAGTFDLGGWDAGLGIQVWSGNSAAYAAGSYVNTDTRARAVDGQLQGMVGAKPVGFYASYATAPPGTNTYNMDPAAAVDTAIPAYGTLTKSAFAISAEVGVVPEKVTLGVAVRYGKSGVATGAGNNNATDNAVALIATYKLAQNMMASFSLTNSSGAYWDAAHQNALGSGTTTINLFTVF